MISKKYAVAATLLTLGVGAASVPVSVAATRSIERAIEFGLLASDNPTLVPANQLTGLTASIKPSVELKLDTRNFDSIIRGELDFLHFEDPEANVVDPRLFARTVGTLVPNFAYLDASLQIAKVVSDENLFRVSEDTDPTLRLQFSPYIEQSYGTFADLTVRYLHQTIDTSVDGSAEATQNGFSIALKRDPTLGGAVWGVGGSYNLDQGGSDEVENATVYGEFGMSFAQIYLIEARAGFERNDFINIDDDDRESELWNVDFTWTPSERTAITVGYESRFFDDGPTFRAEHKTRNSVFTASWTRGISRTRATLDDLSLFGDTTEGNITVTPVTDTTTDLTTNTSTLTEIEPFVDNQVRLSYKLTGRRSDLVVDAVLSIQDQLDGDGEVERRIGRIAFERRLSPTTSMRLAYNYLDSTSNSQQSLNYTENRVSAFLKYDFR